MHRFFRYRRFNTQLAPDLGLHGLRPAGGDRGEARAIPERMVVAFAGDGCFQLTSQEFATAVQYGAAIIVVVVNNGIHGTIRMHQERDYPGRAIATDLVNPDFAALARAYGGHGETVATTDDFAPAFERAVASGKPAIIEVKIDRGGDQHVGDALRHPRQGPKLVRVCCQGAFRVFLKAVE